MLYGKLQVVLLSIVAAEKRDAINSVLASYILHHPEKAAGMGIKELAAKCNVGVGSVSRFCREIGLEGYGELQQLLRLPETPFQRLPFPSGEMAAGLAGEVGTELARAAQSVDMGLVRAVCRDILTYPKVAAFGLMKAESAAICLQSDLALMGRLIYTNVSYAEQLQYIAQTDEKTLILLFSYTGSYFAYPGERFFGESIYPPKIVLITGSDRPPPSYIDRILSFSSGQQQPGHPYQLELMAGILAQETARMLGISES